MQVHHLELPDRLRSKLEAFRKRVWVVKLAEATLAAACGLLVSYLLVFTADRLGDTPGWVRAVILLAGTLGLGVWLPIVWHRWVWNTRQLEQVARLLRFRFPKLSDHLLGIVELVHNPEEQERSESLCRAAMEQVDHEVAHRDFADAVPYPRHKHWAWAAGVPLVFALTAIVATPGAGGNALVRWLMPWRDVDRYTFAQLDQLPDELVVPYAEPFAVAAKLTPQTAWSPRRASARYGQQRSVQTDLQNRGYQFQLPPQKQADKLVVSVGDAQHTVHVNPMTRPELTTMIANVKLPAYLQYSTDPVKDVRGGSVSILKGSEATFEAVASRALASAMVDGQREQVDGARLVTRRLGIFESAEREFQWQDQFGLSAKEPFVLSITAKDDESPSIVCNQLAREQVVLEDDVLKFEVRAGDDFGVKQIGMQWVGIEDPLRNPHPVRGEKILAAGAPELKDVEVAASFSAKNESIPAQSLQVRLFAVDYLPDRQRVYSQTYILHVLTPEEHAIWMTNQLRRWFRGAQAVYEREQQLHETNKELRNLPAEEIEQPENRRRIETQAAAEQANGRRLNALTGLGEQLVGEAAKNDQFNIETLENWARMLQALKDIGEKRMPSVADLLKQAAEAPKSQANSSPSQPQPGESKPQKPTDSVGNNRDGRSAPGGAPKESSPESVPAIVDIESGFNELDQESNEDQQDQPPGAGRLTLPGSAIIGGGPPQEEALACPVQEKVEQAVKEQKDLLDEFAKVADELQKILNNLEGSTFVKRLKAASRRQIEVAGDLNKNLLGGFGLDEKQLEARMQETSDSIAQREVAQSENVYVIQDDLQAYYNRVQQGKFKTVLNEMENLEVVTKLRDVGDDVRDNMSGQSIAQAEFWADTLDRWAEQLVGPG